VRGWLFAIARHRVVDHVRADRARPGDGTSLSPEDLFDVVGDQGRFSDTVLDRWLVEEALLRLSPDHRRVLVDVHLRGRPAGMVAAEIGVPVGTVRSRVFYGLRMLRVVLDEMGVEL
jgi:RNA polymerase sigma-70 factor, ECF subfamily